MGMIVFVFLTIILHVARFPPVLFMFRRHLAARLPAFLPLFAGRLVRTAGRAGISLTKQLLVFIGALAALLILVRTQTRLIAGLLAKWLTGLLLLV